LRTLTPTLAGVLFSFVAGGLIIVGHIIDISLRAGTIWPSYINGSFATYYTNHVVQPLLTFFNSGTAGTVESIIFWAVAGSLIFELLEFIWRLFRNVYKAESGVQVVDSKIVKHPEQWSMIVHAIWRLAFGIVIVGLIYLAIPLARYALHLDYGVAAGVGIKTTLYDLGKSLICWLLIINPSIILLRFYTFRTRLLGDTHYL
jgi:hypothetical protein